MRTVGLAWSLRRHGAVADVDARHLGEMLMHSIEVVTSIRGIGLAVTDHGANNIAAACQRMRDVPDAEIETASAAASDLVDQVLLIPAGLSWGAVNRPG